MIWYENVSKEDREGTILPILPEINKHLIYLHGNYCWCLWCMPQIQSWRSLW